MQLPGALFALKKVLMFSYISGNDTFKPKPEKLKNPLLESYYILLYFQEMESYSSNIKKFLIFFQKKAFLIFEETETPKKFLIFWNFVIFQETKTLKHLHFRKKLFKLKKQKEHTLKKCLIFWGI